ncbi:MAG: hypothetical protein HRU01_29420 [Myxococcales bacterium]|nr:hypothetical protein [Myxococcales bacterium]
MNTLRLFMIFTLLSLGTALPAYADRSNDRQSASEAEESHERGSSASRWASAKSEARGFRAERHHEEEGRYRRGARHDDDDRHEKGDHHDDDDENRPRPPRAKLRIKNLTHDRDSFDWIKLDARKSKSRRGRLETYHFIVRDAKTGRQLPGPGSSSQPVAHVRLPAGRYKASVTVRDDRGLRDTRSRRIVIRGAPPVEWRSDRVEWSTDRRFAPGDPSNFFHRANGPVPGGFVKALLAQSASPASLRSAGGGCGGVLNNGGNGIGIVTGLIGFGVTFAAPEVKVASSAAKTASRVAGGANAAGAGMKIAGGSKSGACVQAQIDAINDQLHFQESQIQDLYSIIDRDQEAFFVALEQIEGQVAALQDDLFTAKIGNVDSLLGEFMEGAALWDPTTRRPWVQADGTTLPLDTLSIAACDKNLPDCCAGKLPADDFLCLFDDNDGGPITTLSGIEAPTIVDDLLHITGSSIIDGVGNGIAGQSGDCIYDCWKNVAPVDVNESVLLEVYTRYAEQLFDAVVLCTSDDPTVRSHCPNRQAVEGEAWSAPDECVDNTNDQCVESQLEPVSNDVVALFDQYNDAIGARYLQSVVALQQAYSMEQLINLYNYNRYVALLCSTGMVSTGSTQTCLTLQSGPVVLFKELLPYGNVGGTYYSPAMEIGCDSFPMQGNQPETQANAFNCAQEQLGMLYAQRLNVLYRHTINYLISDGLVGAQAYPATPIAFPSDLVDQVDALRAWNLDVEGGGLGAIFDYEFEIGRALPPLMGNARTPLDLLEKVAGAQTNSPDGTNWTTDGVLYQAYQIADAAVCVNTLIAFNAGGTNPDTDLLNAYQNYEDCPSIFALHDGTGVSEGFYDGVTVQPYSYAVAPGGSEACPAACQTCADGLNPNDPDSQLGDPGYITWTAGGQGLVSFEGTTECRGFCSDSVGCGDYRYADPSVGTSYTDCTLCGGSRVLALSAPMGGNVRQCQAFKSENAEPCASENDTCSCTGDVYYGKRFVDSLVPMGVMPGSGSEATYDEMIEDGSYTKWPESVLSPSSNWDLVGGTNGSWSGSCDTSTAIFSGQAGDPVSPPTLSASCTRIDGTPLQSQRTCTGGHWGNGDGSLFCEIPGSDGTSVACTNDTIGTDPAGGFYKQCFCAEGNKLTWLRPDSTRSSSASATPLQPRLPYLSCGNFTDFKEPMVAWEYDSTDGYQYSTDNDNDQPPTIFETTLTTSKATFESDIGVGSSDVTVASGVNYEVAFTNISTDCNTPDNIQVDVIPTYPTVDLICDSDQTIRDNLSAATWAGINSPPRSGDCIELEFPKIKNGQNDTTAFFNLIIQPPNRSTGVNEAGPGIPIDLVMQCSDDQSNECEGMSSCMHMVTFRDGDWSTETQERRDEVLAKRGFICEKTSDSRGVGYSAAMLCELSDGRLFSIELVSFKDTSVLVNDQRAKLRVREIID